jgi:hypothetical protein
VAPAKTIAGISRGPIAMARNTRARSDLPPGLLGAERALQRRVGVSQAGRLKVRCLGLSCRAARVAKLSKYSIFTVSIITFYSY